MTRTAFSIVIATVLIASGAIAAQPAGKRTAKPKAPTSLKSKLVRQPGGWVAGDRILQYDAPPEAAEMRASMMRLNDVPPSAPRCVPASETIHDTIQSRVHERIQMTRECPWQHFRYTNGKLHLDGICHQSDVTVSYALDGAMTATETDLILERASRFTNGSTITIKQRMFDKRTGQCPKVEEFVPETLTGDPATDVVGTGEPTPP